MTVGAYQAGRERASLDQVKNSVRQARERGADWIVARLRPDGPYGADVRNSWSRLPWALTLAGRLDEASAVMTWIERHGLTEDGDFRPGAARGTDESDSPVYWLGQVAVGAWLLGHYGTAESVMGCIAGFQDKDNGGVADLRDGAVQDFTSSHPWALVGAERQTSGHLGCSRRSGPSAGSSPALTDGAALSRC